MEIKTGGVSIHVEIDEKLLGKGLMPILFLHGFTGSSPEWEFIFNKLPAGFLPLAIDIIGHGRSDSPENIEHYSAAAISSQIEDVIKSLQFRKLILCGYSMGGRAALSFYSNFPQYAAGLILESTTPGIEDEILRNNRIKSDELLALKIEEEGVEKFGNYWVNLPMFQGLKLMPEEEYLKLLKAKWRNNKTGLINSLIGFGTGSMPVLWDTIKRINIPSLLITGQYDDKFTAINERMNELIPGSRHIIARECGHNIHLEKPSEFINFVNNFLADNF